MNESCASYCVIYLGSDEVNSGRFGFMGHRFMVSNGRTEGIQRSLAMTGGNSQLTSVVLILITM